MGRSSFYLEWARLLKPMVDLTRFRTKPYLINFIKNQIEIDSMAFKLSGIETQNNDELEKLKKGFLSIYRFIYNKLLPVMGYGDIKPLIPIIDSKFGFPSSMDSYSKKF